MKQPGTPAARTEGHDPLETVLAQVTQWWREHGRIVIVLSVVALGALLGYNAYRNKREREEADSWGALWRLPASTYFTTGPEDQSQEERDRIIQECQSILDSRSSSSATPWILLKLANVHYQSGRPGEAQGFYRRVLKEHPQSAAADMAIPALAAALEDGGQYAQAADLFEQLATQQGTGSRYWLEAARNRELEGDVELAQKHYQTFVQGAGEEYAQFIAQAEYRLKGLESGQLLSVPPPPEPLPELETPEAGEEAGMEGGPAVEPEAGVTPAEGTPSAEDVREVPEDQPLPEGD